MKIEKHFNAIYGRAMALTVSHWPLTTQARIRTRVSLCGVCAGQNGNNSDFSSGFSVVIIPPWIHAHMSFGR
jgi:hypothetical protein